MPNFSKRAPLCVEPLESRRLLAAFMFSTGAPDGKIATLVAPSAPHALAVFVGRLNGTSLSWRLTHHGLGASAASRRSSAKRRISDCSAFS